MTKLISTLCGLCFVFAFEAKAPAQTITNQPQSITINTASTATFTVGASGATSYQWQFNGTNLTDAENISGSTNAVLTLENVTSSQAGSYTVIVNNSMTSSNAVLAIVPGTIVTLSFSGLLPRAPGSNVTVQLFDHDKPATVQNFLHYIRSGAYRNMFMERVYLGAILQGGDYGTSNRTDTNTPIYGWDVYNEFTLNTSEVPPFPPQVAGEFYNGPQIKNDFGTLAMALESSFLGGGLPDTGRNGFFFNLTNNSGAPFYFDTPENGPFTVFGRVVAGTNLLNYFASLNTNGNGLVSNSKFIDNGTYTLLPPFPTLPVNYLGTNDAANANLVYCDFNFVSTLPTDTTPPTVAITNALDALLTNQPVIQGTASANADVGLAVVTGLLVPQVTDGISANGGGSVTNYAVGTTNWSLTFSDPNSDSGLILPGTYLLSVQSQDGAGYLSPAVSQLFTVTAVMTNGLGTVSFTNAGMTSFNPIGYPFQEDGTIYNVQAEPDPDQIFVGWTATNGSGANGTSFYPVLTFKLSDGLLLTANFISNDIPNSIAFTYPPANGGVSSSNFNITGTITPGLPGPVSVTCTIFSTNTGFAVIAPMTTTATTTNWSIAVTNLPTGSYRIQAVVVDGAGESTMIGEDFICEVAVTITSPAASSILYDGSPLLLQGTASAELGLALVTNVMIPEAAADGMYPVDELFLNATGTTNWSVSLSNAYGYVLPGEYYLTVTAIDTAGNSNQQSEAFSISAIQVNGSGTVSFVQGASSSISPIGYPLQLGSNYVVQATPGSNWTFVNWTAGTQTFTSSALQITMFNGLEVTANFAPATLTPLELIIIGNGTVSPITNGEYLAFGTNFQATATPGPGEVFYGWNTGAGVFTNTTQTFTMTSNMTLTAEFISSPTQKNVISFTYPPANAKLQTNSFEVKGRIAPKFKSAQVTVQIVSTTSGYEVGPLSISGINSWSVAVTNLPPDSYVVEAVATYSNGLSTAISEKFSILDFKKVAGTYEGLFICNNDAVSPTNSGYFTCTISASGAFSGKLSFPAYKPFVIHEVFYADGVYEFSYPNFPGNPFVVYLNLNLAENNNVLSGDIFSVTSNGWYSPLVCYRAATKLSTHTTPATGKYLLKLPYGSQTNNPETNGYASLTVGAGGVLTLSGALPDGASFSQSARVSTNGVWPLYVTPTGYGVQGMLMGWENWQTNSAQGDWTGRLYWYKNANVGTYYTGGVNTNMTSTGTNYVAPLAGNYSIAFQGGTVSVPITNNLSVARNGGQFRPVDATDKLAISISGSGVLTGHFVNPADNTTLQFKGAFFGQSNGGSGFILEGSGKTGGFVIKQE